MLIRKTLWRVFDGESDGGMPVDGAWLFKPRWTVALRLGVLDGDDHEKH